MLFFFFANGVVDVMAIMTLVKHRLVWQVIHKA